MKTELQCLAAGLIVSAVALLLSGHARAQGDKGPWQPILSKEVYQELAQREAKHLQDLLNGTPDAAAISRAKFGAVFLAALTMCAKEGMPAEELRAARETALQLATTLNNKAQLPAAKQLAAALPKGKADPNAKVAALNWASYLELPEMMDHYRPKAKGGDGMHDDLQSNIRLKGALNGIEEKIRALTMKEMAAANLMKEGKELEILGYKTAVVGSLTSYYAPAKKVGNKDPQEWRTLSNQMRDQSVDLAIAAKKGDAAALFKAINNLFSSCNQCHSLFRN